MAAIPLILTAIVAVALCRSPGTAITTTVQAQAIAVAALESFRILRKLRRTPTSAWRQRGAFGTAFPVAP